LKVSRERRYENRRRILDEAARLFRERGSDRVSIDDVMTAAVR
jgi:TetR/AcrR family transcriptional repressor of nem operon